MNRSFLFFVLQHYIASKNDAKYEVIFADGSATPKMVIVDKYIIIPSLYVLIVDDALELESSGIESRGIKSLWMWADSVDPRNG